MKPNRSHPAIELANRLRSAVKTGRRLHLDPCHVAVLMGTPIYEVISAFEAQEIRKSCADAATNDNRLGPFGSGNAQTMEHGASAGSNIVPLEAASRGARSRLSEAVLELHLRNKQSMH